jgi:hypothetical protein
MGSGKGGGSAKGGGGKGGGKIEGLTRRGGSGGGMMGGNGSSAAAAPARYNPQQDFYGSGNMVNQPLSGYYQTYPSSGGNNYAPPPAPVKEAPKEAPAADPNDPLAGMSPAARAALASQVYSNPFGGSSYSASGNRGGYNPSFLPNSGGGGGSNYNPSFLPNQNVFGSTLLNPNYYR